MRYALRLALIVALVSVFALAARPWVDRYLVDKVHNDACTFLEGDRPDPLDGDCYGTFGDGRDHVALYEDRQRAELVAEIGRQMATVNPPLWIAILVVLVGLAVLTWDRRRVRKTG